MPLTHQENPCDRRFRCSSLFQSPRQRSRNDPFLSPDGPSSTLLRTAWSPRVNRLPAQPGARRVVTARWQRH